MKYILTFLLISVMAVSSSAFNVGQTGKINGLPYIIYNSTNGMYYGVIGKGENIFALKESLSISAFLVSDGGKGANFSFSLPDPEYRIGKKFDFAFDISGLIGESAKERFYGVGSNTVGVGYTTMRNAHYMLDFQFSRSINKLLIGEVDLFISTNHYSDIVQGANPLTSQMQNTAKNYSGTSIKFILDRRDQLLNPHSGIYSISNIDIGLINCSYIKGVTDWRFYSTPILPDQILATRFQLAQAVGDSIPIYEYPYLGGRDAMRGYSMNRWRDKASGMFNFEYRFPVYFSWIQAVTFYEIGNVASRLDKIDSNWKTDYGVGLNLILGDSVVVRGDFGFGSEGMNAYFFYNQAF